MISLKLTLHIPLQTPNNINPAPDSSMPKIVNSSRISSSGSMRATRSKEENASLEARV